MLQIITDLHLHSKYARAVSPQMRLAFMAQTAKQKGLGLLSAPDWTHPVWLHELKEQLAEYSEGIYTLQTYRDENPTKFLLSTEISCIYKQGEKLRRIHSLVFVPDFETAERTIQALLARGANLTSDGRPIIGMSVRDLLELVLAVNERSLLIPCHVWTPHFGMYGSASGFDSLDEAFGDLASYVYGIETGLSSDPYMNWQIPELRNRTILSFSDAHSLPKMGREATVLGVKEVTYEDVRQAIMSKSLTVESGDSRKENMKNKSQPSTFTDPPSILNLRSSNRIMYTIEFYPEEGKYHYSGHRNCRVSFGPEAVAERGTNCPVCGRKMTEGVLLRVQTVGGRAFARDVVPRSDENGVTWYTDASATHAPYVKLVPLLEVIAESLGMTVLSQKVRQTYERLCRDFSSELDILLRASFTDLEKAEGEAIARGIMKVRTGDISIKPGFDGEFGKVRIYEDTDEVPNDS